MTTKEKLLRFLVSTGMFPNQAEAVFERALPQLEVDDYRVTWDGPCDDYPEVIYGCWLMVLKEVALEWIDENLPNAWYRPMFTPDPEAELAHLKGEKD
jgi:hypothetical protein